MSKKLTLALAVILVFAIGTGAPERYLSANNLRVVLAQTVIVALGATAATYLLGQRQPLAAAASHASNRFGHHLAVQVVDGQIIGFEQRRIAGDQLGIEQNLDQDMAKKVRPKAGVGRQQVA